MHGLSYSIGRPTSLSDYRPHGWIYFIPHSKHKNEKTEISK